MYALTAPYLRVVVVGVTPDLGAVLGVEVTVVLGVLVRFTLYM